MHWKLYDVLAHLLIDSQLLQPEWAKAYQLDCHLLHLHAQIFNRFVQIFIIEIQINILRKSSAEEIVYWQPYRTESATHFLTG